VLAGADVLIGLSGPGAVTAAGVRTMAADAIVFAMANPVPEVHPEEIRDDVAIMATGRSDYPNQINNVLAFPGVFKGALDVRARTINEEMKLAAAHAIAASSPKPNCTPTTSSPASSTAASPNRSPTPQSPAASRGANAAPAHTNQPPPWRRCAEPRARSPSAADRGRDHRDSGTEAGRREPPTQSIANSTAPAEAGE
jgi:malic enzyme